MTFKMDVIKLALDIFPAELPCPQSVGNGKGPTRLQARKLQKGVDKLREGPTQI